MKRTFAFITALLMIAATACGKIEEEIKAPAEEAEPSISESSAIEVSSSESSEASESQTDSSENSSASDSDIDKTDSKDEKNTADDELLSEGFINESNCIILDDWTEKNNISYDKKTIYRMAENAAKQFNCVVDKDKEGFLEYLNIPAVMNNDRMKKYIEENIVSNGETNELSRIESNHYYLLALFIISVTGDDLLEELTNDENADANEIAKRIWEALQNRAEKIEEGHTEGLNDDAFAQLFSGKKKEVTVPDVTPENYHIIYSDDLVCKVIINGYYSDKEVTCADIDIEFMLGENKYVINGCNIWNCGEQSSTYFFESYIEDNEYKGLPIDKIRKQAEKKEKLKDVNSTAKYVYNAAAEFFADSETRGIRMAEAIENGEFRLANSADGLELKASYSDDDLKGNGDAAIIRMLKDDAFAENRGRIYLGITKFEYGESFFIQYKNADGLIGQYPDAVNAEGEKNIIWKTFLPRQD